MQTLRSVLITTFGAFKNSLTLRYITITVEVYASNLKFKKEGYLYFLGQAS